MHGFHFSNLVPLKDIAGDGVVTESLGVQPLSVLLVNLRFLNDTGTLANNVNAYRAAQAIGRLTILHKGTSIISMRGEDIVAMNFLRWNMVAKIMNGDNVNNEQKSLTIPIVMGRYPFLKSECFPAVGKGELTIEMDLDDADTGYDTLGYSIDALELPDAKPKFYERRVQQTVTWAATGNNDIDLPVGNVIRGIHLWGTTGYDGAAPAPSWGQVSVLLDNQEAGFRALDWETVAMLQALRGRQTLSHVEDGHFHTTTTDGNAQTAVETLGGGGYNRSTEYNNHAFLDFDPTDDDAFALDATKASRLQIRAAAETADAVRCITIERIAIR